MCSSDLEQMLLDSITYAKDDVNQRMVIEARTEGEQMVYTVERFMQKNAGFLSEEEIAQTNAHVAALKKELAGDNKDAIHRAVDALNEYTRPFAERLMDVAISHAMKGKSIE